MEWTPRTPEHDSIIISAPALVLPESARRHSRALQMTDGGGGGGVGGGGGGGGGGGAGVEVEVEVEVEVVPCVKRSLP